MELHYPGNSQYLYQKSEIEKESPKSESRSIRIWSVQNEVRGVLSRIMTSAVRRTLNSANSRETNTSTEDCVRCSEDEKRYNELNNETQSHQ